VKSGSFAGIFGGFRSFVDKGQISYGPEPAINDCEQRKIVHSVSGNSGCSGPTNYCRLRIFTAELDPFLESKRFLINSRFN
jgi:hypothetical protein